MDVKEAVNTAFNYFNEVYQGRTFDNVLLEEVEMTDNGKYWLITIGYSALMKTGEVGPFQKAIGYSDKYVRQYKLIKIDDNTQKVISMKIRELEKYAELQ